MGNGESTKISFSMAKVTFWISIAVVAITLIGGFVSLAVKLTEIQADILAVKKDIIEIRASEVNQKIDEQLALEDIRMQGTAVSRENSAQLKVVIAELIHYSQGFERNDKDHEKILSALAEHRKTEK